MKFLGVVVAAVLVLTWIPGGGAEEGGGDGKDCLKEIMPCKDFLKSAGAPPATCCIPLRQAMEKEVGCLCTLFYNQRLLDQFNVTQEEVRHFPTKCGAPAPDRALCAKAGVNPPPNSSTPVPATPATPTSKPPPTADKSSGSRISGIGQSMMGVASVLVAEGMLLYVSTF